MQPLRVIIAALGSHGDMHPFLAIAGTLRERGHCVSIIAPAVYAEMARRLEFDFVAAGSVEQYERLSSHPDLWHPTRGFAVIARGVGELLGPYYRAIAERYETGRTVLVMSSLALGGRVAQEKLKIPGVTVHLSPAVIRSAVQPARTPPLPVSSRQPGWLNRLMYRAADALVIDRAMAPVVNQFRASLGLVPVHRLFKNWIHSPDRVIGLFPEWFAPPPPDWPRQTVLTGFPLFDEAGTTPPNRSLQTFLADGDAPIAFTAGSAMRYGRTFFLEAVKACRLLGKRGVLLARHREQIPEKLPETIRHVEYAPFSQVFPKCAAVVHHGGIGTSAQALAAGVGQVVAPMNHDQPDNAARLIKLGVAEEVPMRRFNAEVAARAISKVLDSEHRNACAQARGRIANSNPMRDTADWIEKTAIESRRAD